MKKITTILAATALATIAVSASATDYVLTGAYINAGNDDVFIPPGGIVDPGWLALSNASGSILAVAGPPGPFATEFSFTNASAVTPSGAFGGFSYDFDGSLYTNTSGGTVNIGGTQVANNVVGNGYLVLGSETCTDLDASSACGAVIHDAAPGTGGINNDYTYSVFPPDFSTLTMYMEVNSATSQYLYKLEFAAVSEVPVPAAAWLFGSALVGLAGVGRKRKMA